MRRLPAETPDGDDKKKTSVRYWLNQGYRWGVIAAGDTHDGRPGNSLFSAADGGLAGLYVNEFSRHGVRRALAERRVFGTNGCRALLDFETGGAAMGGVAAGGGARTLRFRVVAAGESMRVVLVKNGEEIAARDHYVPGLWSEFTDTSGGDAYYYLRAEGDRGFYSTKSGAGRCLVWSSPIWVISP
ncbi:MAG: hypothetical protein M5R36_08930 [Deltaproteobacteria bacterium]|nr:hypothetical protein [Deltaproteobacteria bacterium]